MNTKLQQAIQATRTGNTQQAQLLLTEILKENPQESQAWFLLSHLVDSEQKQVAYLSKVLALDPTHEKAKQRLARLKSAVSIPMPPTPTQVMASPVAEKTSPPMVDEPQTIIKPVQPITPPPVKAAPEKPAPTVQMSSMPTAVAKPPVAKPPATKPTAAIQKPPMSKKALAAQAARKQQQQRYNSAMMILGLLVVVILVALILQFL